MKGDGWKTFIATTGREPETVFENTTGKVDFTQFSSLNPILQTMFRRRQDS
jgi:hypothetical protein